MRKLFLIALFLLIAGTAWAESGKVQCYVNGEEQEFETEEACDALGGKVVPPPSQGSGY